MKPTLPATVVLILALAGPAAASRDLQTVQKTFEIGEATEIEIDFPVGELIVDAGPGDRIEAEMTARCSKSLSRCAEQARKVRLVAETRGQRLVLRLEGLSKLNKAGLSVRLRLDVPPSYPLRIEMGVGDLEVHGMTENIDVEMGVGDARLELPGRHVGRVKLTVGVGEVGLRHGAERLNGSGFISRMLRWSDGEGSANVQVDLGVGDVKVALD